MKLCLLSLLALVIFGTSGQTQMPKRLRYFMQSPGLPASKISYGANPTAGRYIQSGDAKIYYEVYGKGDPFVVLHGGIVGSPYEMGQFIDSLSKRYLVIAISTRGHGKSEMGTVTPSYERKAEDVLTVINAVSKDSVSILGFSDGAYIGYFLAASRPDKVKKLIAIGAGKWNKGFRTFTLSRDALSGADSLYFRQQLELRPEPEKFDEWLSSANKYYNSISIGKETLGKIECPVLIMAGERDENAPLKTVIAAYEMLPKAQLSIIPFAPHPVFLINFPAVWTSITPFLKQ